MVNDSLKEKFLHGPSEHDRLQGELTKWAEYKGYTKKYLEFENGKPDVSRENPKKVSIFIGDAKDSANEDAKNSETWSRIQGYFQEFTALLSKGRYKGGIFAIATNSDDTASVWAHTLNRLKTMTDDKPNFRSNEINQGKTWIISWKV